MKVVAPALHASVDHGTCVRAAGGNCSNARGEVRNLNRNQAWCRGVVAKFAGAIRTPALHATVDDCAAIFLVTVACSTQSKTLGPGECRVPSDCAQNEDCFLPNNFHHCGPVVIRLACTDNSSCSGSVCRANPEASDAGRACAQAVTCTTDSECEGGQVCRTDPTIIVKESEAPVCTEACKTNRDCAVTDACDDTGHCRARTCSECPSYFSCASESCAIRNCATDAECSGGYCVNGSCAGALGTCQMLCF
jgi:hypothetical protein